MGKRGSPPTLVILVAAIRMLIALIGVAAMIFVVTLRPRVPGVAVLGFGTALVTAYHVLVVVGLLRGGDWARWLALLGMPFLLIGGVAASISAGRLNGAIVGLWIYGFELFALTGPAALRYFLGSPRREPPSAPSLLARWGVLLSLPLVTVIILLLVHQVHTRAELESARSSIDEARAEAGTIRKEFEEERGHWEARLEDAGEEARRERKHLAEKITERLEDVRRLDEKRDRLVEEMFQENRELHQKLTEALEENHRLTAELKERPVESQEPKPAPQPGELPAGGPAEIRKWIEDLRSRDAGRRFSAAVELGNAGDPAAVAPLIRVLTSDQDQFVRRAAARSLGELKDLRAVPPLIATLADAEFYVSITAAKALRTISGREFGFRENMKRSEVRRVQAKWERWWRENSK